jgi:hypothetical protein
MPELQWLCYVLDDAGFKSRQGQDSFIWGPTNLMLNGYRVLYLGQSGQDMKFAKSIHLLPRLRTSGALPLLPLRVFMACRGTSLPFYQHMCITSLVIMVLQFIYVNALWFWGVRKQDIVTVCSTVERFLKYFCLGIAKICRLVRGS